MGIQESSYRISQAKPGSPAANLHIESMLDFIVYKPESNLSFDGFIAANENKEMPLTLFNIASQEFRQEKIFPKKWEGEGLLGFRLIKEDYKLAHTRVIRILSILMNSPLHNAGCKPNIDYIISTTKAIFDDIETFNRFIESNDKKEVELVVYNSKEEKTRVVKLVPNSDWGGSGYLGGEIGFGHIHSLPVRKSNETVNDDTLATLSKTVDTSVDVAENLKERKLEETIGDPIEKIETISEAVVSEKKEDSIKEEVVEETKDEPTEEPIKTEDIPTPSNMENEKVEKAVEVTSQINHEDTKEVIEPLAEKEIEKTVEVKMDIKSQVNKGTAADTKATYTTFEEDIMI
jgi:hypothetical protein